MKKISAWVLFMSFLFVLNASGGEFPIYSASRVSEPPSIDGALDDACWVAAEKTAPLVAIGGKAVDVSTTGMLCWDKKTLYIAFVCNEPLMDVLEKRIRQGQVQMFDESIEVFLDADYDRSTYVQLRVGITGGRDSRYGIDLYPEIHERWSAGVRRGKDRWTVEMAVPFELLGDSRPHPDTVWGLNLNRQRLVDAERDKWTCWSDTKGGFHSPARFGWLIFADYTLWLRCHYAVLTGNLMNETADLMMRYPYAGQPLMPELSRLDDAWLAFLQTIAKAAPDTGAKCRELLPRGAEVVNTYKKFLARMRLSVIREAFH